MISALARLSPVELRAARLDGDVFELGGGYLPADAAETPALRAATLAARYGTGLAAVGLSAAWVHGATELEPDPHLAQSIGRRRAHRHHPGLRLRESAIDPGDVFVIGTLPVASSPVTLADLALAVVSARSNGRRLTARVPVARLEAALAALAEASGGAAAASAWLRARVTPHKRAALALLDEFLPDGARRRAAETGYPCAGDAPGPAQAEVTR